MKISMHEVEYVANLAYLELDHEEKEKLTEQLNSILEYIDKLNELDTANVEPTSHVLSIVNAFADDRVENSYPRETILENAPQREDNYFKVPRIVE